MSQTLSLSTQTQILPCPNCGQTINTSMKRCPFCAATIDSTAAEASAQSFSKVNQAISDASYLKIMAGTALTFLLLILVPFLGIIGAFGLRFLEFAIPFMSIRWWILFGKIKSPDPEFTRARRTAIWVTAASVLFLILRR